MPFSRDPDFISRGDLLDQISTHCSKPGGRAALCGLGGVGKSQLAIEYAYRTKESHSDSWVFWVHAGTKARVEEGFRAIADAVNLPGRHRQNANVLSLLHTWLSNERNGTWLMILDSADDDQIFYGADKDQTPLVTYLPQSRNGSILITTRDSNLAFRVAGNYQAIIKIGPMEPEQALAFLSKKTSSMADLKTGAELVKALDYIPLAISQAASYIQMRSPRCTPETYLTELHESDGKFARLLAYDAAELRRDGSASNAVMKSWQMSFDHIQTVQPSAADLLSLMCFFDNQSIPESVIRPAPKATGLALNQRADTSAEVEQNTVLDDFSSLSVSWSRDSFSDADEFSDTSSVNETAIQYEDDVTLLNAFCLISTCHNGKDFEMHRLVQLATKRWLAASKKQEQFKQLFIKRISAAFPEQDPDDVSQQRHLFTHAQIATSYRPSEDSMEEWVNLCYELGRFAQDEHHSELAKTLAQKALSGCKKQSPILACKQLYAEAICDLGQVDEAEKIFSDILEACKILVKPNNGLTFTTMLNLSYVYMLQKRLGEAEELASQAIELGKSEYGATDSRTLAYMSHLAVIYSESEQFNKSEALNLYIMEGIRNNLGEEHEHVFITMGRLVAVYIDQKRFEEAYELQSKIVERWKILFGPDHRETFDALHDHAYICEELKLHEEAEQIHSSVLRQRQAICGADHPDTFYSTCHLACLYYDQHRLAESESLYKAALKMSQLPKSLDGKRASIQQTLAFVLHKQKKFSEAGDWYKIALASHKLQYGPEHIKTLRCMFYLARDLYMLDRYEDAKKLLRETLEKPTLGLDDDLLIDVLSLLMPVLTGEHELGEAESLASDLVVKCKTVRGEYHFQTIDAMEALGEIYRKQERLEEALATFVEVWKLQLAVNGETDDETIATKVWVGFLHSKQEHYNESVEIFRAAFEFRRSIAGAQDRTTLDYMRLLLCDLVYLDMDAARELVQERLRICQETFGPDDEDTLKAIEDMNDLMELYSDSDEETDRQDSMGAFALSTSSATDIAISGVEQG